MDLGASVLKPGTKFKVAVFPLLNEVLFPGTTLPLHIFEDRYRQMLRDIEDKGWPLAVSLVIPEGERTDEVKLNTICGAGPVQVAREYPGSESFDILVHGQDRVKLCRVIQEEPYLVMEAEVLGSSLSRSDRAATLGFEELRNLMRTWVFLNPDFPETLSLVFDEFSEFGELSDFFVFHFLKRAPEKQIYLNCTDPFERAQMLARFLGTDLERLSRKVSRARNLDLYH